MAKLTRYKNSNYFNQYAILQYVRINDTYITSQIIYPMSNSRIRFENHNDLNTHLTALRNAIKEYEVGLKKDKIMPKFVVYIDKESYASHPIFKNERYSDYIDFRVYNNIVPGYTTCIPDLSINSFNKQLETAIKEIIYYVKNIGLVDYTDKVVIRQSKNSLEYQTVSFAYTSRRFLEKDVEFKPIVSRMAYKNINKFRYPSYDFVRKVVPDIKNFNANKLVCHGDNVRWKNVCKYDIDSSFWAISTTEYTGKNPRKIEVDEFGITKKGETLLDIISNKNNMYFAKIRINSLLIPKEHKCNWLAVFDLDLSNKSMYLSNVEVNDILDTYDVTIDDFIIEELYLLEKTPFTDEQRKFYQTLHKRKAKAKQDGDNLLKTCLKVIGHSLHGYALGNWFTDEDNLRAYLNMATMRKKGSKHIANHLLTPIDSMYLYSYARSHLLKILDLFGDNFYYDTDSIVTTKNDKALREYNEWIDSKYHAMGLDSKDYTHDGHTMGYLELEEVCDNFCHLSPKFYLWTNNGKLHSTTAGYLKDSIANKIEEVSGLKGTEALKWFCNQDYVNLDIGYISDGVKYIKSNFEYKKRTH